MLFNLNSGKKLKVPRLVRMHSAEMQVRWTRTVACARLVSGEPVIHLFLPLSSSHTLHAYIALQDVDTVAAGDVVAMFGVDCSSMDTFTDGR